MKKKTITLHDLAMTISTVDQGYDEARKAINELVTRLDEKFFKSGKIDQRGDFRVYCGLSRH